MLVSELNQSYDLGDIRLVPLLDLEEITVTAEAIQTAGIDTQVFRLDEGATQTTGSLLDAMRNLPGVTVDQEGRVSLRGSDQVAILIDGRQSSLTGFGSQRGLDNVSAANVEAIEIIHNPSASFDAAGMAGSSTSSTGRSESLASRETSACRSGSASSQNRAPICRPSSAAIPTTRRSSRA